MKKPGPLLQNLNMEVKSLIVGPLQTNCYFLIKKSKTIIIDPGDEGERICGFIQNHSLEPSLILATHGHLDHVNGIRKIQELYPIPFYLHSKDTPLLGLGGDFFQHPVEIPSPTGFLDDLSSLTWEGEKIEIIYTPGHSPGSLTFRVKNFLFTGDTLFQGSVGRWDLPGGDETLLQKSLRNLLSFPDELLVFPGHGTTSSLGREKRENPFLLSLSQVS